MQTLKTELQEIILVGPLDTLQSHLLLEAVLQPTLNENQLGLSSQVLKSPKGRGFGASLGILSKLCTTLPDIVLADAHSKPSSHNSCMHSIIPSNTEVWSCSLCNSWFSSYRLAVASSCPDKSTAPLYVPHWSQILAILLFSLFFSFSVSLNLREALSENLFQVQHQGQEGEFTLWLLKKVKIFSPKMNTCLTTTFIFLDGSANIN